MSKVKRLFFSAYGSLMNVDKMVLVCPESYVFGWGSIQDFELEFRTFENINKSVGSNVPVVLWSITEEDEMELDSFFDLDVYRKEALRVILSDVNDIVAPNNADYFREGIKALIYLMKDENKAQIKAPSLDLYRTILDGYKQNNIKTDPLTKAVILAENNIGVNSMKSDSFSSWGKWKYI